MLQTLGANDPDDRKRCVRLLAHFVYRGHKCLVFEALALDLRKLNRELGRGCGLSMPAVSCCAAVCVVVRTRCLAVCTCVCAVGNCGVASPHCLQ